MRDVAIPLGELRVVHESSRSVSWRTTLRLGVMARPARGDGAEDAPDRRPVGAGDQVEPGSVLLPIVCAEPCVHRLVRRDVLLGAYDRYVETGEIDVTFRELWTLGDLADEQLVPEPRGAEDWGSNGTGEAAASYEADLRSDRARLAMRRILQRHPLALLSPGLHLARAGRGTPADQPAAAAAADVAAFARVVADAQHRGAPEVLDTPDPDVDLLHRFPRRRPGPQPARNPKRFVALLGLDPMERGLDRETLRIREKELTDALRSWRAKDLRPKGSPWAVPDVEVGHALVEPDECTLGEGQLLRWATSFVASSPSLRALEAISAMSPYLQWHPSPWLRGDEPRPVHRVRVRGRTPAELDEVGRLHARGAPWAVDGMEDAVVGYVVGGPAHGVIDELSVSPAVPLEIEVDTFG